MQNDIKQLEERAAVPLQLRWTLKMNVMYERSMKWQESSERCRTLTAHPWIFTALPFSGSAGVLAQQCLSQFWHTQTNYLMYAADIFKLFERLRLYIFIHFTQINITIQWLSMNNSKMCRILQEVAVCKDRHTHHSHWEYIRFLQNYSKLHFKEWCGQQIPIVRIFWGFCVRM